MVITGRNGDTALYSILDTEWPAIRHTMARPGEFRCGRNTAAIAFLDDSSQFLNGADHARGKNG